MTTIVPLLHYDPEQHPRLRRQDFLSKLKEYAEENPNLEPTHYSDISASCFSADEKYLSSCIKLVNSCLSTTLVEAEIWKKVKGRPGYYRPNGFYRLYGSVPLGDVERFKARSNALRKAVELITQAYSEAAQMLEDAPLSI
jgi:hypothetical protein